MKNLGEKGAWAYPDPFQGLPNFFEYPPIISGTGRSKATNVTFCTHIHGIDRNKRPLKISAKVAVGVGLLRDSTIFRAPRAHRAVILAVAQLSCYVWQQMLDT